MFWKITPKDKAKKKGQKLRKKSNVFKTIIKHDTHYIFVFYPTCIYSSINDK